jgi:murein L,D-transpeptidase YcbB/YkuD
LPGARFLACALALSFCFTSVPAAERRLLWSHDGAVTRQAAELLQVLRDAERYGLRRQDYASDLLGGQIDNWTEFDRVLSAEATRLLRDLHFGRVSPRAAEFDLPRPRPKLGTEVLLEQLARAADVRAVIASVEPQLREYRLLEQALARYRALAADGGLTQLPAFSGRSLKAGDRYRGTPALRRLLSAVGDLEPQAEPLASSEILDPALRQGLQRFQQRHGLDADGVLDKRTFASLTTPLSRRVLQIELTLERLRWLPAIAAAPIIINIPQFRLFAFQPAGVQAADVLQMPVIVGQTYPRMRTPVFVGEMTAVVFRPYWDVPRSILVRELLPEIRARPDYLERHRFEIVRGLGDDAKAVPPTTQNVDALAAGELRLRQQPGPDNALGLIKFVLLDAHNVYLHDTPAQQLFLESRRAFSHGCIRVGDPAALAVHVLKDTPGDWTAANVLAAMHGDVTRDVSLSSPIPVLVLYGTAVAIERETVYFFDDIYGHDARLARLLESR